MKKRICKIVGTIFVLLALTALVLPAYNTYIDDGEAWNVALRGYNMIEFSPWGILAVLLPVAMLGIAYCNLNERIKTLPLMAVSALSIVSIHCGMVSMRTWIYSVATGFVYTHSNWGYYIGAVFVATVLFYLDFNRSEDKHFKSVEDLCEYLESENLSLSPIDVCEEKFSLCDYPYTFSRCGKGEGIKKFSGFISFATADGYFTALGYGEKPEYIESGCVEITKGEKNIGYISEATNLTSYGVFYGNKMPNFKHKAKIMDFDKIESGCAEIWIPDESKSFEKIKVRITPLNKCNIECFAEEIPENTDICGAVVIQNGQITAVVSSYDEKRKCFKCISSELVAKRLVAISREDKILQALSPIK